MNPKHSHIENTEINVSMNRQFNVFTLYNFIRHNPQIACVLVVPIFFKR